MGRLSPVTKMTRTMEQMSVDLCTRMVKHSGNSGFPASPRGFLAGVLLDQMPNKTLNLLPKAS